mmetsp:Transcript_23495/g.55652  ORF Transcript_23495/g.55652 Transcript_23495/m.55652 type:complete len:454 (-) Transcript_23495:97-1458(-)|eukprot:CAMPEP_0197175642 /NCGR_PEP_ID=MMETSP1423-20130617/1801_1 /TAXON_ID=476441 /ORGANISM="Pseudo-nitzschia heimii, Strain UNC1101" /LENGTH=453 /DNA_ID=CAMNT_0042624849 /DNA_START=114 /DNA_END=1475 /DNA_ORIENTATION=-
MSGDTDNGTDGATANANANDANDNNENQNENENDNNEPQEVDNTTVFTFIFETATSDRNTKSLTDEGVETIANHKYKPGTYTALDNLLNPVWTGLTELLPMWLAPNMVTLLGAIHSGISFGVIWYYAPNFDESPPDWVFLLAGYCSIAYYTLDCMDGKQARRTGQSSPLGQLFDHGFDCLCLLSVNSNIYAFLMVGGTRWLLALMASAFFPFFMAQWEEYYTGSLPHSMGNFGVTEVNYGLAMLFILNSFIDREAFWTSLVNDVLPAAITGFMPNAVLEMELRHAALLAWFFVTTGVLELACLHRIWTNDFVKTNNLRASALSKLTTPFLVSIAPFLLPQNVIEKESRFIVISQGLLMAFLTIKLICFSMARQSYAMIQMEAVPFFAIVLLLRTDASNTKLLNGTVIKLMMGALSAWYTYRIVTWARNAIDQICKRLDIYCFSIKHPKKTKSE